MKYSNFLKNIFLIGVLCNSINAFATVENSNSSLDSTSGNLQMEPSQPTWPMSANKSVYWPANFPSLGSDNWWNGQKDGKAFTTCGGKDNANPNYGTPTFNLSYNFLVNVQNANDKLRYDVYSKVDGKYLYKDVALINGRNIISIQPSFINDRILHDTVGNYVIIFKGVKYNKVYVNTRLDLGMSISNTSRGCQRDDKFDSRLYDCSVDGGVLFYHQAKFDVKVNAYTGIYSIKPIPIENYALSKLSYSGDKDPSSKLSCTQPFTVPGLIWDTVQYDFEHVARLYVSIDAYQIDLNGSLSNYVNPHMDSGSSAYFKDSVSYDLHKIFWLSK